MQNTPVEKYSPDAVLIILDYLYTQGEDAEQWLINEGIDTRLLKTNGQRLSAESFTEIWRTLLNNSPENNLGLKIGKNLNAVRGNILGLLASNSPTLESALDNVCKYHALMSGDPQPYMKKKPEGAYFCQLSSLRDLEVSRHTLECMYSAILTILRQMARKNISPAQIEFTHAKPRATEELEAFFNCPIVYDGKENTMLFNYETLSYNALYANEQLLGTIEQHAKKMLAELRTADTWTDKVQRTVITAISKGNYDINSVASELTVSSRKLQQVLKSENTNFKTILDSVRKEMAVDHLQNSRFSIAELALLLGFSEQSAFNHAFKRWTGKTPGEYKQ